MKKINLANKKVAIYGGSFNPIHIGHLLTGYEVIEKLGYDYLFFIPANIPVHKNLSGNVSGNDRLQMLGLSIDGMDRYIICDIEVARGGLSYTVDTVKELRDKYSINTRIGIIIGDDWVSNLDTWKSIDLLEKECQFIALYRYMSEPIDTKYDIKWVQNRRVEISSTEIRQRVKNNLPIDYMVHDSVKNYILDKKLYLGSK